MSLFDCIRNDRRGADGAAAREPARPEPATTRTAPADSPDRTLLGIETEYAMSATGRGGSRSDRSYALHRIFERARKKLVGLPDGGAYGMFLENGSRFYLDCGEHPELSTPECASPRDVVRYTLAGERILAALADDVANGDPISQVLIFKGNVDYSGSASTWGCHESYLHRSDQATLSARIIPHLVTRVVYAGAGGFVPNSDGISFTLSPRMSYITRTVSASSTGNRGIFHTKDEPLCRGGYHRLHVLCGESLCSQVAQYLKLGTTALIVALIDAGASRGDEVSLANPLAAMRRIASDPSLRARVPLESGARMTALEIQRIFLEAAEAKLGTDVLPSWAEDVCRRWRVMLDRLAAGPDAVATSLDWAIKRSLYDEHVRSSGFDWQKLGRWQRIVRRVCRAGRHPEVPYERVDPAYVLQRDGLGDTVRRELTPALEAYGLTWSELPAYLRLRSQLFELDTRYGQIGAGGVFDQLDRAALLDHALLDPAEIDSAVTDPPASGRAHRRGLIVRELASERGRYFANWDGISDAHDGRVFDLRDPYGVGAQWKPRPALRDELLLERLHALAAFRDRPVIADDD